MFLSKGHLIPKPRSTLCLDGQSLKSFLTDPKVDIWVSQFSSLCSSLATLIRKKRKREKKEKDRERDREREDIGFCGEGGVLSLKIPEGKKIYC